MKRILFGVICLLALACFSIPAFSSPQDSLEKLTAASQNPNTLPSTVLTDAEIDELVASIKGRYKDAGNSSLTDKQAAVLIGQLAGMKGMANYMRNAFAGASTKRQNASPQTKKNASEPEGSILASGILSINADNLFNKFKQNEFAAKKEFTGKEVVISGTVRNVETGSYYKDGKPVINASKVPTIRLNEGFFGYFSEDNFDFSQLQPNDAVNLYCKEILYTQYNMQGLCQVVATYRLQNGSYAPTYANKDLQTKLTTPPSSN